MVSGRGSGCHKSGMVHKAMSSLRLQCVPSWPLLLTSSFAIVHARGPGWRIAILQVPLA